MISLDSLGQPFRYYLVRIEIEYRKYMLWKKYIIGYGGCPESIRPLFFFYCPTVRLSVIIKTVTIKDSNIKRGKIYGNLPESGK